MMTKMLSWRSVPEPEETPWDVEKKFRLPGEASPTDGIYII